MIWGGGSGKSGKKKLNGYSLRKGAQILSLEFQIEYRFKLEFHVEWLISRESARELLQLIRFSQCNYMNCIRGTKEIFMKSLEVYGIGKRKKIQTFLLECVTFLFTE